MDQELNTTITKKIEKQLLAQKKQIVIELDKISHEDRHEVDDRAAKYPDYGDKTDENAQEIADYSTSLMTEKVLEKSLDDIDKALSRIKTGSYGICKYCGNAIAEKRLLARPTANSCVSCKTELQEND